MDPLTVLFVDWGCKAGLVTGLWGSFQKKPEVYSSSWASLQILSLWK